MVLTRSFWVRAIARRVDGLGLAEAPTPSYCLIDLLEGVIQADENHVVAMLKIQSEPADGRLTDEDWPVAVKPRQNGVLFLVLG